VELDELARATHGLDDMAFTRRFPVPALIFLTTPEAPRDEDSRVDTPSGGIKLPGKEGSFSRTSAFKATDAFPAIHDMIRDMGTKEMVGRELAHSPVVFLEKSKRNPFESMITLGRATNNDHCLPLPTISKFHAYFSKDPSGTWRLTDQRATNGTWVDGQRLQPGDSAPLADGSRVGFGPDARAKFFTPQGLYGFLALYRSGVSA
jgi:pSer/pThr/pTyr-binding forkhead associated (FHA) protein